MNLWYRSVGHRWAAGVDITHQHIVDDSSTCCVQATDDHEEPHKVEAEGTCDCLEDESCPHCQNEIPLDCEEEKYCSAFSKTARLLVEAKAYDLRSLVGVSYRAGIPVNLKARRNAKPEDMDADEAATALASQLSSIVDAQEVTIDEVPQVFGEDTAREVGVNLVRAMHEQAMSRRDDKMLRAQEALRRTTEAGRLRDAFLKAIRDTAFYRIGVVWAWGDDTFDEWEVKESGPSKSSRPSSSFERVHPNEVWFTSDWTTERVGRAVFRYMRCSKDWLLDRGLLNDDARTVVRYAKNNSWIPALHYGSIDYDLDPSSIDVLVGRGKWHRSDLAAMGVDAPGDKDWVVAEVWYTAGVIVKVSLLPSYLEDGFGVSTTRYREVDDCIYGRSMAEYIEAETRQYEAALKNMDRDLGTYGGAIITIDQAGIQNLDTYTKEGQFELDLSKITFLIKDSTDGTVYGQDRFGQPAIRIDRMDANLQLHLPLLAEIKQRIDERTVPSVLLGQGGLGSGFRDSESINRAYEAANAPTQELRSYYETTLLDPNIKRAYLALAANAADNGDDTYIGPLPEFLLTAQQNREAQSDQEKRLTLQEVLALNQANLVDEQTLSAVLNTYGRDVLGLPFDLVKGVTQPQEVAPDVAPAPAAA